MDEWDDEWIEGIDEAESSTTIREHARASLPLLALSFMLASAVSVAALGGAVATGVGESSVEGPTGFTFAVDTEDDIPTVVISHTNGSVPNPDRVYVVDEAGTEVPWTDIATASGIAEVTGETGLMCPSQGETYHVVFHDTLTTETVDAYEVTALIPPDIVRQCEASD